MKWVNQRSKLLIEHPYYWCSINKRHRSYLWRVSASYWAISDQNIITPGQNIMLVVLADVSFNIDAFLFTAWLSMSGRKQCDIWLKFNTFRHERIETMVPWDRHVKGLQCLLYWSKTCSCINYSHFVCVCVSCNSQCLHVSMYLCSCFMSPCGPCLLLGQGFRLSHLPTKWPQHLFISSSH